MYLLNKGQNLEHSFRVHKATVGPTDVRAIFVDLLALSYWLRELPLCAVC